MLDSGLLLRGRFGKENSRFHTASIDVNAPQMSPTNSSRKFGTVQRFPVHAIATLHAINLSRCFNSTLSSYFYFCHYTRQDRGSALLVHGQDGGSIHPIQACFNRGCARRSAARQSVRFDGCHRNIGRTPRHLNCDIDYRVVGESSLRSEQLRRA